MDHKDLCEHTRIRLIAAAIGHQQCTKTAACIVSIPGGDRVIAIGTPAEVADVLLNRAARDVLAERRRQIEVEGWTPEHDDKYSACELTRAAATYATCSHIEQLRLCGQQAWPWPSDWWKRGDYRRDLVKAGALILAEIERLDRDRAAGADQVDSEGGHHA